MTRAGVGLQALAVFADVAPSTLARRLCGEPFQADELGAVAAALDTEASDILAQAEAGSGQ